MGSVKGEEPDILIEKRRVLLHQLEQTDKESNWVHQKQDEAEFFLLHLFWGKDECFSLGLGLNKRQKIIIL